jgi:hypothetical protein
MRPLAAALLIASLALLVAAVNARSQARSFNGSVWVGVKGWGSVKAARGTFGHPTTHCTSASCPATNFVLQSPRAVLNEKPYKGWKFNGWRGGCKSERKPKCVLDASHAPKDTFGEHSVRATARFVPVAVGLTGAHPIPLGTAAEVGYGFVVRVNSTQPDVQLETPPPAGTEYFAANLTVTYNGTGSKGTDWLSGFRAVGNHKVLYLAGDDGNGCSDPGPQPPLDTVDPLLAGQSATGYICWTIAANDASSLKLYFGSGTLNLPPTTWFALH